MPEAFSFFIDCTYWAICFFPTYQVCRAILSFTPRALVGGKYIIHSVDGTEILLCPIEL